MIFLYSCKTKKHHEKEVSFFPVLSYIKGQIKDIDTSLYRIIKIETIGNGQPDTEFIRRDEVKKFAADFLNLPDIGSDKWKDDYEESKIYDKDLQSYILNYTTQEKDNSIKSENVMIDPQPDEMGNTRVKTIIIDQWINDNDSLVRKNMVWQNNKRFYIIKSIQKEKSPEKIEKLEVVWNNESSH